MVRLFKIHSPNILQDWCICHDGGGTEEQLSFVILHRDMFEFRVKPDALKCKTRPYVYRFSWEDNSCIRVWNSLADMNTEDEFESYMRQQTTDFKWLAPATEHEVEYE